MSTVNASDDELLLAILNTTPIIEGRVTDAWATAASARQWLISHTRDETIEADLVHLRATREALQNLARGEGSEAQLARLLSGVSLLPDMGHNGLRWSIDGDGSRALAVRAIVAYARAQQDSPGRLRPCANHECSLFLIDRSKNNSARWCSMASCGNRLKARRYHARERARES